MTVWNIGDGVALEPDRNLVRIDGEVSHLKLVKIQLMPPVDGGVPDGIRGHAGVRAADWLRGLHGLKRSLAKRRTIRLAGPDPFGNELHLDTSQLFAPRTVVVIHPHDHEAHGLTVRRPLGRYTEVDRLEARDTALIGRSPARFWDEVAPRLAIGRSEYVPGPEACGIADLDFEFHIDPFMQRATDLMSALGTPGDAVPVPWGNCELVCSRVVDRGGEIIYSVRMAGDPEAPVGTWRRLDSLAARMGVFGAKRRRLVNPIDAFRKSGYAGRHRFALCSTAALDASGQERAAARRRLVAAGFGDLLKGTA
jgi:hypothetical protein